MIVLQLRNTGEALVATWVAEDMYSVVIATGYAEDHLSAVVATEVGC